MTPNLIARLARLEGQQPPPAALASEFTPGIRLLWLLLAVHAGDLQPHEAIAEGTARALGYERAGEMRSAMQADGSAHADWNARHSVAITLLLVERGGGAAAGMDSNEAAIRSLVSEMPADFLTRLGIADVDRAIRLATEWVSL
ncbi:hypothetical protein SAMN05216360_12546 [Methylobacterium phyllostachyos]|uniref:Uncharacterized protein n=1 Tax=Methylobacterium phyllostachyos TaxID=582672 RepID=A0A1H0K8X1_9HYPH|nr:hypothetical protein [Methylobacterium phyllostachyos]SDO52337.1 hypothetical protein SAMN05216360_12546 [Methylobacterium phyllostachyos]